MLNYVLQEKRSHFDQNTGAHCPVAEPLVTPHADIFLLEGTKCISVKFYADPCVHGSCPVLRQNGKTQSLS